MATRDCTGAPATRELTAAPPSAVRPCLGGRRWRARPAAMTTLETLKTEGHRARASAAAAVDDFVGGGWGGAPCAHTHTLSSRRPFFYCYIMHAAPDPARRTRLVPASSVKSEKMRRPRFFFVGFFLQILVSRTSVRPSTAAPAPTALHRRIRRAHTICRLGRTRGTGHRR